MHPLDPAVLDANGVAVRRGPAAVARRRRRRRRTRRTRRRSGRRRRGAKSVSAASTRYGALARRRAQRRRPPSRPDAGWRAKRTLEPERRPVADEPLDLLGEVARDERDLAGIPAAASSRSSEPSTGRPSIGSTGFGQRSVSGRSRVPCPAAITTAGAASRPQRAKREVATNPLRGDRLRRISRSSARSSRRAAAAAALARGPGGPYRACSTAAANGRASTPSSSRTSTCSSSGVALGLTASPWSAGSRRARARGAPRPGADRASGSGARRRTSFTSPIASADACEEHEQDPEGAHALVGRR